MFKRYKNVPEELKEESEKVNDEPVEEQENQEVDPVETSMETENVGESEDDSKEIIDYSYYENQLKKMKGVNDEKSN